MKEIRQHLKNYHYPEEVLCVIKKINKAGFQAHLVGGAVRDIILGRELYDYDLTTNARPEEIIKLFPKVIETGIKHGTVTIVEGKYSIEVTTYRKDGEYKDFRRPESIEYSQTIEEDLKRRDFTMNALAYHPIDDLFIDLYQGITHIQEKKVVAIRNPVDRFNEDALRMMRGIRFGVQLNFEIEDTLFNAIKKLHKNIKKISIERVHDELTKILLSDHPARGIRLLEQSGLLQHFLPELVACKGVKQNKYHIYDVYEHILHALENSEKDLIIRLSVLFHDIAKPKTKRMKEGHATFYNHEGLGAEMAETILKRLKYPNQTVTKVKHLVKNHMFNYTLEWKDSTIRRFIHRVGVDNLDYLLKIRQADASAGNPEYKSTLYLELFERIEGILASNSIFNIQDLAIDGRDIMEALSLKPSKQVGEILKQTLNYVMENPENNDRTTLLTYINQFNTMENKHV